MQGQNKFPKAQQMKGKVEGCSGAVMAPTLTHLHPQDVPHLCPVTPPHTPMSRTFPVPHRYFTLKIPHLQS